MNLCDTNALREYPLLPELVAEENNREMYGFIQNIRKKSSRLVTDYCKYYMSKLENYPEALGVTLKKGAANHFPSEWLTTYITKNPRI